MVKKAARGIANLAACSCDAKPHHDMTTKQAAATITGDVSLSCIGSARATKEIQTAYRNAIHHTS
jgi:hypothetical protein